MNRILLLTLLVALTSVVSPVHSQKSAAATFKKMTLVFKSGATLSIEYDSGTIVNLDNDFQQGAPANARPKQYNYSQGGTNGSVTVDHREVAAVQIRN